MVMGLPGVGKSYFARTLAREMNAVHLNSDIVRKQLLDTPGYSESEKSMIYHELFRLVREQLVRNNKVIVDATFSKSVHRKAYEDLIRDLDGKLSIIRIIAPEALVKDRLAKKRPDSDADYFVYQKLKNEYDEIVVPHLVLDSGRQDITQMIALAKNYVTSN